MGDHVGADAALVLLTPLSMPSMMAAMERIMMTSIATAKTLMRERRGRWTRLPSTSLFMLLTVYGRRLQKTGCGAIGWGWLGVGRASRL